MNKTAAMLALLTASLVACGGSNAKNIDGPWTGALRLPDGVPLEIFFVTLTQESGSAVEVSGLEFNGSWPCFTSSITTTATFAATGTPGGIVDGNFTMTISTAPPVNNVLTLNGTRGFSGYGITSPILGSISGTWTMTGQTGCEGRGILTMSQSPPP